MRRDRKEQMKNEGTAIVISIIGLLCTGLLFFPGNPALSAEKLNLGMITDSPSKTIQSFTPFMDYLKEKGIPGGTIQTAKTIEAMTKYLKSGEVDFIFESPFGIIKMMDETGAVPILIREKDGIKEYSSVLIVLKDSPSTKLPDLVGKVVAFEDPTSTTSFVMPKVLLESAGLKLKESQQAVPGEVAYYFSKDDDNSIAQVKTKKADAAGTKKTKLKNQPDLRVLKESQMVPRHVVLVRKGVPSDKLFSVLLGMNKDPKAQDLLKKMETPTGFSEFQGNAANVMNTTVRKALGM